MIENNGKWIMKSSVGIYMCSVCNNILTLGDNEIDKYKFCPFCSMDMRDPKERIDNMLKIRLTENAYLEGGDGVFYRYHTKDGKLSACGIYGHWYEAHATDDDDNEYRVVWEISDREAFDNGEEDCCDWKNPSEICSLSDNKSVDAELLLQFRDIELLNKHITFKSYDDVGEFIQTDIECWKSFDEGVPDLTIDDIAQEWEEWINDNPDRIITKEEADELWGDTIALSVKELAVKVLEGLEN